MFPPGLSVTEGTNSNLGQTSASWMQMFKSVIYFERLQFCCGGGSTHCSHRALWLYVAKRFLNLCYHNRSGDKHVRSSSRIWKHLKVRKKQGGGLLLIKVGSRLMWWDWLFVASEECNRLISPAAFRWVWLTIKITFTQHPDSKDGLLVFQMH